MSEEINWEFIMRDDFEYCHKALTEMEAELKKHPGTTAFEFLKPIRYMISEAMQDVFAYRKERRDQGDDILNGITLPEE